MFLKSTFNLKVPSWWFTCICILSTTPKHTLEFLVFLHWILPFQHEASPVSVLATLNPSSIRSRLRRSRRSCGRWLKDGLPHSFRMFSTWLKKSTLSNRKYMEIYKSSWFMIFHDVHFLAILIETQVQQKWTNETHDSSTLQPPENWA